MRRFFMAIVAAAAATTVQADTPDSGLPLTKAERVGMSSERLERIAPAMRKYIDQQLVPGTVTLIARNGKVVHFEAQGHMDAENKVPMRKDALFRIASMTKPITSVALMMLWEEGRFNLNDPVSKFLPEFADQKVSSSSAASALTGELVPVKRPATVRDMLTHTAGLANSYRGNVAFYENAMQVTPEDTLETYIKKLAALPLNYQPGEAWQYSGATDVVGRLVEVIAGESLDDYLSKRIFKPLGMQDTHFFLDDTKGDRLAAQYTPGENQKIKLQDPGSDKSRWIAVVDRGAAASAMSEGSAYWGGAYCTLSWFDREQGIVAVMMTQVRPYNHIRIREDFQQLVYQAIIDK